MKISIKMLAIIITLSITACQSNDPNHVAQEALKDELMVVHDEVMPKMGDMHKLKKKLKKLSEQTTVDTGELKREIDAAILALEKADDGMMDWMAAFSVPSKLRKDKSHEEIMAYLREEKEKVEKVKEDMLSSIKKATDLIEKNSRER